MRRVRKYGTNPHVSARVKPTTRYHLQQIADGRNVTLADVVRDAIQFYLTATTSLRKDKRVKVVMNIDNIELKVPRRGRIPFYKGIRR